MGREVGVPQQTLHVLVEPRVTRTLEPFLGVALGWRLPPRVHLPAPLILLDRRQGACVPGPWTVPPGAAGARRRSSGDSGFGTGFPAEDACAFPPETRPGRSIASMVARRIRYRPRRADPPGVPRDVRTTVRSDGTRTAYTCQRRLGGRSTRWRYPVVCPATPPAQRAVQHPSPLRRCPSESTAIQARRLVSHRR